MQIPDRMQVAGWREFVALPEWGIRRIRAKLDTGARTSAVHVSEILELGDGRLRFEVVVRERPVLKTRWIEAQEVRESRVKPIPGKVQARKVVRTLMVLADIEREIEIGLVCRRGMLCRMLLGRTALEGLLVNSSEKYLLTSARKNASPTKKSR